MLALTALVCSTSTTTGGTPGHPGDNDIVRDSLAGVWLGQIPFVLLAVLAIASEYSTGMIRTTLWPTRAAGRRSLEVGARRRASSCWTALLASAVSFVLGQSLLRGTGSTTRAAMTP